MYGMGAFSPNVVINDHPLVLPETSFDKLYLYMAPNR